MSRHLIYRPTREKVRLIGVANEGQYRPGDPGTGMRLYLVESLAERPTMPLRWEADAGELLGRAIDGNGRATQFVFKESDWLYDPVKYDPVTKVIRQEYDTHNNTHNSVNLALESVVIGLADEFAKTDPTFNPEKFHTAALGHTDALPKENS